MIDFVYIFIIGLITLVYLIRKLSRSGIFDNVEVSVTEQPPFVNKSITVYYKHHIGPYRYASKLFREVADLMPKGAVTFGIYYDDPKEVKEHLLQSAIGVVYGEDGKDLYCADYGEELTQCGYERMILPAVERAVVTTQKFDGFFSIIALKKFTYPKIGIFVKENKFNIRVCLEFYQDGKVHIVVPLDHQLEFSVHQLMTLEALETKMARRKWDSDIESESCSDTEVDEEADSGDLIEETEKDVEEKKKE